VADEGGGAAFAIGSQLFASLETIADVPVPFVEAPCGNEIGCSLLCVLLMTLLLFSPPPAPRDRVAEA